MNAVMCPDTSHIFWMVCCSFHNSHSFWLLCHTKQCIHHKMCFYMVILIYLKRACLYIHGNIHFPHICRLFDFIGFFSLDFIFHWCCCCCCVCLFCSGHRFCFCPNVTRYLVWTLKTPKQLHTHTHLHTMTRKSMWTKPAPPHFKNECPWMWRDLYTLIRFSFHHSFEMVITC